MESKINLKIGDIMIDISGAKVRIICDNVKNVYPIIGLKEITEDLESIERYCIDGTAPSGGFPIVDFWKPKPRWDIIPSWLNWVAISENGTEMAFGCEPRLFGMGKLRYWSSDSNYNMVIHPDYATGWKGDWTKSKVNRPK